MGRTKLFYDIDDTLFDVIDSEEKAYILGFVASDGHINKEGKIKITLNIKDVDILKKIRDFVCRDIRVTYGKNTASLQISRMPIAKAFSRHLKIPFGEPKSFTVQFPDLPKHLTKHFIRGFFDGDGHITTNLARRNYFYCGITSASPSMLESILSNTWSTFFAKHTTKEAYVIKYYSRWGILLADYLYKDSKIYLDRKYKSYEQWKPIFDMPNRVGHYVGVKMFTDNYYRDFLREKGL